MLILFQLAIVLLTVGLFLILHFTTKDKSEKVKTRVFKILGLVFFIAFLCRIFSSDVFGKIVDFNMPQYGSKVQVVFMGLLSWTCGFYSLLLICAPLIKSKNILNILVVLGFPFLILNLIFFKTNINMFIGDESILNWRTFQFAIELIIGLTMCLYLIFTMKHKLDFKLNKKLFFKNISIVLPFILLMSMPLNLLQQWFGTTDVEMDYMSVEQHIWVLIVLVIGLGVHFALRDKPEEVRNSALVLLSVSMFINYFSKFDIATMGVGNLPLHICNLATALIPLALITRNLFLFSFTYFINVAGALIAILLPEQNNGVLSYSSLVYMYEHTFAFLLPILIVSLGLMPRTKKSNFKFAVASFSAYFVLVLICNVWFVNYDSSVDYFYLNSNFIANKLHFLLAIREITVVFNIGSLTITLYPIYWLLIYIGFVLLLVVTFFIYREFYRVADINFEVRKERMFDKNEYLSFIKKLDGDIEKPANKKKGIMIKFTNFSKKYAGAERKSVNNFNLEVKDGEVFGFLGSNGAGKSTTIKSLVGILPFEEGTIEIDGYDISKQPLQAKRVLGYVPDNHAVYERLTGRQYINYVADLYGVSQEDRERIAKDLLEKFNLSGAVDNPIKSYSHGMKQKITIIASLIHSPKLWVLDEPLTGLDPQSSQEVKEYMREHAKNGNTVFFSSHVIEVVEKICDRVAIIKKGELQGVYDLKKLKKEGKSLVDLFMEKVQ